MSEAELVARVREFANDPAQRTAMSQKLTRLLGHLPHEPLPPPATPQAVHDVETQMGFPVPSLLARLWTEVANGGFGPGGGLFGVNTEPSSPLSMSLPNLYLQSIADRSIAWPEKLVIICEWGCGDYSAIDCSTAGGEVIDLIGEDTRKGRGCTFAEWIEDWLDGADLSK
jgi:hypothetical protein